MGPKAAKSSERTKRCPVNLGTRVTGDLEKNNCSRLLKAQLVYGRLRKEKEV